MTVCPIELLQISLTFFRGFDGLDNLILSYFEVVENTKAGGYDEDNQLKEIVVTAGERVRTLR